MNTTEPALAIMQDAKLFSQPEVLVPTVLLLFLVYKYILFPTPPDVAKLRILNSLSTEWFPYLRAVYRNTLDLKKTLHLHSTCHKNETVRIPILGPGKMVMLPGDQRKWLIDQPESILSMHQQTDQHFQFDYGTIYPTRDRQQVHVHLVTTKLTSQIGNLIPTLSEELDFALSKHWDVGGEEWKEVCVYETLRVIIGQPRDQSILHWRIAVPESRAARYSRRVCSMDTNVGPATGSLPQANTKCCGAADYSANSLVREKMATYCVSTACRCHEPGWTDHLRSQARGSCWVDGLMRRGCGPSDLQVPMGC